MIEQSGALPSHSSLLFVDQSGARILAPLCDKETVQVVALKQSCENTHTHTPLLPILESSFVIIRDDVGGLIDNLQQERLHKNRNSAQSIEESYLARSSISHSIRSSIRPRSNRISLGIGEFHLHEKMLAVRNNSGGGMKEISFLPIRHPGGGSGSFYFHAWMMLAGTKIRGSPRHDKDEFNPRETIETLRK